MAQGLGDRLYIANIGDCRAYLLRDERLQRLTKDHNMASLLVDAGKIVPEEAMRHPARNLLTMYLGMERAASEVNAMRPEDGDLFLLRRYDFHSCRSRYCQNHPEGGRQKRSAEVSDRYGQPGWRRRQHHCSVNRLLCHVMPGPGAEACRGSP